MLNSLEKSKTIFVASCCVSPWDGGAVVGDVGLQGAVQEQVIVLAPPHPGPVVTR